MFGRKKDEETDKKIDEEIDVPDKYIPDNLKKK